MRIKGEADKALLELCKKYKREPSSIVEELLIQSSKAARDDEICKVEAFNDSIKYTLKLSFAFPYECERFDVKVMDSSSIVYLERVPKRHIEGRLPFYTRATVIFELTEEDKNFIKSQKANELSEKYSKLAFETLKAVIIAFRRVTNDYYNIGVIEPPMNLEEFLKLATASLIVNHEEVKPWLTMWVKEDSFLSVAQGLEENLRIKILEDINRELSGKELNFLALPHEYFDAAKVFYYHEQWNLCLLQSVIAMEAGLASLVFRSSAAKHYLTKEPQFKIKYKEAGGLPEKIKKFLFPTLEEKGINQGLQDLRKIMPSIYNSKSKNGIYDLRSKVVHEGIKVEKEDAERAIEIAAEFFKILMAVNKGAGE